MKDKQQRRHISLSWVAVILFIIAALLAGIGEGIYHAPALVRYTAAGIAFLAFILLM